MDGRKPFDTPGVTTTGDGDATPLLPDARRAMFVAKLLASTAQVPVWRTRVQHPSGATITTNIAGPIERVGVHVQAAPPPTAIVPGTPKTPARLVWLPEGFMITPRSAAAPDGYGMPNTSDGRGTPGGPMRQVLINRFPGNQYPDALVAQYTGGSAATARFNAANLFFQDWELDVSTGFSIGLRDNTLPTPAWRVQFTSRFIPAYQETEGDTWLCHRPMAELRAQTPFEAAVHDGTNAVRAAESLAPLQRPVRGRERQLSSDIVYQIAYSGIYGHSSTAFRPGHHEFVDRVRRRDFWQNEHAENLVMTDAPAQTALLGSQMVAAWDASPEHHAAMVTDWADGSSAWPMLEISASAATATHRQPPPYALDTPLIAYTPPIVGTVGSEIFSGVYDWVYAYPSTRRGDGHAHISGGADQDFGHTYFDPAYLATNPDPARPLIVAFKGRNVVLLSARGLINSIMAAKLFLRSGQMWIRIVTLDHTSNGAPPTHYRVREGVLERYQATQAVIASFAFPADMGMLSTPRFSASATRMVFGYTTMEPSPPGFLDNVPLTDVYPGSTGTYDEAAAAAEAMPSNELYQYRVDDFLFDETLHFMELQGSAIVEVHTQFIDITCSVPAGPVPAGTLPGARRYRRECVGGYDLFADYSGESIVYARVEVNSFTDHSARYDAAGVAVTPAMQATPFERRLRGKLVFPGGGELVFQDNTTTRAGVSGFFLHILYLDVLAPGGAVYVRYDMSSAAQPVASGALWSRGNLVRNQGDSAQALPDGNWADMLLTEYLGLAGMKMLFSPYQTWSRPSEDNSGDFSFVNDFSFYTPSATCRAALVGDIFDPASRRSVRKVECVGPMMLAWPALDGHEIYPAFYRGEAIIAGRCGNTLRYDKATPAITPFFESSLNLGAITGLGAGLTDITPIGVI